MSEDILVNIQFHGINQGTFTQMQVTLSDIAWEDLELMVRIFTNIGNSQRGNNIYHVHSRNNARINA